ncbi:DNA primase family protein, partial [Comamonas thiooxydans]|uniref:DNA primase family protein n=1 Tax=Comamonas thiooxydans TaxID=363952 RepID=UPI0001BB1B7A
MAMQWLWKTEWSATAANARAAAQTAALWLPKMPPAVDAAVLPLKNGYLHLAPTGNVLQPHDKAAGLQYVIGCDYDSTAPEPARFNHFLQTILPDVDVRNRVQEYVGYTLLPDSRFQRLQLWLGNGANGKGVLANIVQALHAKCAAVQLDALDGFKLAGLIGASLIYADETPQRGMNEQILKSAVAGELLQIDRKYREPLTLPLKGKWLVLANQFPSITDQSNGLWRRFDIVPFPVTIPERDRDPMLASTIIKTELSGVLNWSLIGLQRLLERGRFDECLPSPMRSARRDVQRETNSVQSWADDRGIELSIAVETSKTDVYANYVSWCRENGMSPVASPKFWKRMPDTVGHGLVDGRKTITTGRIRTCNIRLP